jgi:glycosyltransferase involved in cell wall biosynthesis/GT2 family glycosyltransferase
VDRTVYDKLFFDQMTEGSLLSARVVLPLLFQHFAPESVVDVGCGRGTWLKAAGECGAKELLGLDGDYLDRDALLIDARNFQACDLAKRIELPKRFDLAISVEVAEHLPFDRAESFVADLVQLSDCVLFSAALPYQGGTDHINEQWLEFWAILFRRHDYVACDLFRSRIWSNKSVEYWYSQNLILFCKQDIARNLFPPETIATDRPLSFVHPLTFVFNTTRLRPLSNQALYLEFEDYQNLLAAYLAGETTLPLLKTPSAKGEIEGAKVDLFPHARTRILNLQEQSARHSDQLRAREQAAADLRVALAARDETCTDLQAVLAAKDETLRAQENELQIFRTSKLQRLRSTIFYEKLSARKIAKIMYLMAGLVAPEALRKRGRLFLPQWKRTFELATRPRPKIEKRIQEEWPADRPLLSVIIPCFNYGRYVEEAVDSVLSQTFQDFEIIVVDGGSTDEDTLRILRSFKKWKTNVYFRTGRHLAGDNRNFGISQSRGKYICCLDADDRLKSTYLEKALFLLETYHYDLVSSSVECFGARHKILEAAAKPSLKRMTVSNQFSTVAVFPKQMWEKAHGYHDSGLGRDYVAEDWDLWVRMMALGARAINIPEPLMLYRIHDASLTSQAEVRSWEEQGKEILHFNQEHLKRENYRLSARRNASIAQVQNPNLNLVTSYQKAAKKPAILLALPYLITGGANTIFLDIAEHLAASGFDLSVVTTQAEDSRFGDNTAKYLAITGQVYHLYNFLPEQSQWKDFLFHLIETRNIGILLLAGSAYVYGLLPEIKQKFPQLKVVDQLFNEFGHIENNRKYSKYIDFHVVASEVIKDILLNTHGELNDKIRVIVHGVDVEGRFNPDNIQVGAEIRAFVPQGKFLVSFIGRFSEEKCPKKFVEIVNLLKNEDNLHFLMIGNGPEYPYIKQRIRELQLGKKIYAPGFVPDPRPFLKASGVVVIPSTIEGIPILLMESLALGVPVIASAVGGIPSMIQDGLNGFLCEPSDINAFVRAIRKVAGDEILRNAMRANARKFALQHLDVSGMKNDYRQVFVELLAEKRTQEKWPEDRPLVSVVIPSFNYGRYLEETIDSILEQTFQDFEIIVTDGGSTDENTLRVLQSLQKPKTKVYFNEGRHLLGDNRNLGIARARGKYICCLDSDDKLKPTYLEKALFLLETYHYDIVSTSVQCFGGSSGVWRVAASPTLEQVTYANQFAVVAVFRRDMWEEAQGYRDRGLGKDLVAEDWDLWVRMMALGARAINIPEPLMLYRVHDASLSKQAEVRSWEEQGKEILKFNQEHLKRKNYLLSAERNAAIVQVEDPYLNLVTSYQKAAKKPAILLALPYLITGGADSVFLEMGRELTSNGFDLAVMTTVPSAASFGDNTAHYETVTKQIYHLHQFLNGSTAWKEFVFYLIDTRKIDILLLAGSAYIYEILPGLKQRFPRLKVVDHLFNEYAHIADNRKFASFIDAHIVVNEVIKRVLVNSYDEVEGKISVIPPGVDVEKRFNPSNFDGVNPELDLLVPQSKFLVSFIGRFSEEKCPEKFVEMANSLRYEHNLDFVMLGNGPRYNHVKEKIRELNLEDRIYAPGNVNDVRPYLKRSGVLVIPSAIEGVPVTLMESMAFGVPVIASAVGGIPSVIRDGFNGFVCHPSDLDGFLRNIKKLAGDEGLRRSMSKNARQYALQHLSIKSTNRGYHHLFLSLSDAEGREVAFAAPPDGPVKEEGRTAGYS